MNRMDKLGNNDNNIIKSIRDFILPSFSELLLLFLISILIIIVVNAREVWFLFTDSTHISSVAFREAFSSQSYFIDSHNVTGGLGSLSIFLFWVFVGSIIYMAIWATQHFYRRAKDDIQDVNDTMPAESRYRYWQTKLAQHIYFVGNMIVFTIYTVAFIVLIAWLNHVGSVIVSYPSLAIDARYFIVSTLITTLYVYGFSRLWHITSYTFRLYFGSSQN